MFSFAKIDILPLAGHADGDRTGQGQAGGEGPGTLAGRIVYEVRSDWIAMHLSPATRAHGLDALAAFVDAGGPAYIASRDVDRGPSGGVSATWLGPYMRHRLLLANEVIGAVRRAFEPGIAQAVARDLAGQSYAAGWLTRHPVVHRRFLSDLVSIDAELAYQPALEGRYRDATAGATGIACFDGWIGEAAATGLLHRCAWRALASIWIFTLALPWQLGARFMLRHVLDADLASTLLVWREVAGLEGDAPFLVTGEEIARRTAGRFPRTTDLAVAAGQGEVEPAYAAAAGRLLSTGGGDDPALVLVTAEDLHPESWPIAERAVRGVVLVEPIDLYGWLGERVLSFKRAGLDDAARRAANHFQCPVMRLRRGDRQAGADRFDDLEGVGLVAIVPPKGPAEDDIAVACERFCDGGCPPTLELIRRPWDQAMGEAAAAGQAAFEAGVDDVLAGLGLGVSC